MREARIFLWSSATLAALLALMAGVFAIDTLFMPGEHAGLFPGLVTGAAVLLSVPSACLLLWGRRVLGRVSPEAHHRVKLGLGLAASPLIVFAIGFVLSFIVIFVFGLKIGG